MNRFPPSIETALQRAHPSWQAILKQGLTALEKNTPGYLDSLENSGFLPTQGRLFAAFSLPVDKVRFVLVGEGPYPREASASGYCFMDGAVQALWSDEGLSKPVNRAVSLRNFIKMLLVADGYLLPDETGKEAMRQFIENVMKPSQAFIQSRQELQANMLHNGFLLLNAALVYRQGVPAAKETRYWQPFLNTVLTTLAEFPTNSRKPVTLVLWGKMAERFQSQFEDSAYQIAVSEHPYNLSFIGNRVMQSLFQPLNLLKKPV
ncbi:MAG: uracil-DNA glycosylase [Oxalobacter sp.]|nr:uracil-DNA glycosylase [Oxalobacter sp.]